MTSITYAPVKGLGLVHVDEVELELTGVRENRRFHLIDDDGRLINGKFAGTLVQVAATADRDGESLSLRFPDGSVQDGPVTLGDAVETNFYGRPVAGRLVNGAFAEALSQHAGRSLRLVRVDEPGAGSDRGVDGTISAVSRGSLEAFARRGRRGERRRPPLPDAVRARRDRAARRGRLGGASGGDRRRGRADPRARRPLRRDVAESRHRRAGSEHACA